jgi:hypothetical protein
MNAHTDREDWLRDGMAKLAKAENRAAYEMWGWSRAWHERPGKLGSSPLQKKAGEPHNTKFPPRELLRLHRHGLLKPAKKLA